MCWDGPSFLSLISFFATSTFLLSGSGSIDAKELAHALRKRNEDLSFAESIDHAIEMVAKFDRDGDAKLDRAEFQEYIDVLLKELEITFAEFSEFLVTQILFSDEKKEAGEDELTKDEIKEEVKQREKLYDMLKDPRMAELFELFDKNGSGDLTFKEVAIGLYQVTRNVEEATKTAMNLLLMMDKNDSRVLGYDQFGRLILGTLPWSAKDSVPRE